MPIQLSVDGQFVFTTFYFNIYDIFKLIHKHTIIYKHYDQYKYVIIRSNVYRDNI